MVIVFYEFDQSFRYKVRFNKPSTIFLVISFKREKGIEKQIIREVRDAFVFAKKSPYPQKSQLMEGLFQ